MTSDEGTQPTESPADEVGGSGSVSQRAASGVLWLTAQRWALRIVGFVTIAILTRFLDSEAFGTVAAASTVLPFFTLLADLGFAAYIVQADHAGPRLLSTGFWFSTIAGAVLFGVVLACAPLLGRSFSDPAVVPVLRALSLTVVLSALGSVPMAILRRAMRFRAMAAIGGVAALVAQIVAIVMALTGYGVWALVGQTLTASGVGTVLTMVVARWRPRFVFSGTDFRNMSSFGAKVLGVEFVAMLRTWAEASIISSSLGLAWLGYMNIAQRLIQIVQDLAGGALVPVTSVAFAKVRESSERILSGYLRALRLTYASLSLPLIGVAVAAPILIPLVFSDGWEQSIPVAQVLAIAGTMTVGAALDHGLFYGKGRPGLWFVYAALTDVVTVAATFWFVQRGILAIAWAFLVVCVVATLVRWLLVAHLLGTRPMTVARPFGMLLGTLVLAGGSGFGAMHLAQALPDLLRLLLVGSTVLTVHLAVVRWLAPSVFDEVRGFLVSRVRGGRSQAG